MKFKINSLQRITNTGKFIPEIDGLRFVAICMVIFYHMDGFLFKELNGDYRDSSASYTILHDLFLRGYFGVEVFFVISAFVVSLPFAHWYLNNSNAISLKDYFLRRITRIEPPYLISLMLILLGHLYLIHGEKFSDYVPSFYYSLFYIHGFNFHRDFQPLVNNVTWSLEIEVQFYVLAPFIFYLLFKRLKFSLASLILLTLFFSIITKFPKPDIISLYEYFHYFMLGIVVAYMKVKNIRWKSLDAVNSLTSQSFTSVVAFLCMLWTDITYMGPLHTWFKLILSTLQLLFLFIVFYNLLISSEKKIIITTKWITIIGGMCYSLYLFHNQIIMLFGHLILKGQRMKYFISDYLYVGILLWILIIILGMLFYLLVERPCMDKRWPSQLYKNLQNLAFKLKSVGIEIRKQL